MVIIGNINILRLNILPSKKSLFGGDFNTATIKSQASLTAENGIF